MINGKKSLLLVLLFLFPFSISSVAMPDEPTLRAQICIIRADGTTEIRHVIQDPKTGKMVLLERESAVAPRATPFLKIEQSLRWEGVDTVKWTPNKFASKYRSEFNTLFKNIVNKWRGSKDMPEMVLANGTVDTPAELSDLTVLVDGKNGIYITEDNGLIDSFEPPWIRVDGMMFSWYYGGSAPKNQQKIIGGKVFNPHTIVEVDGFFRSDLFTAYKSGETKGFIRVAPEFLAAHEFGHAFGYKHSADMLDYMCYFVPTMKLKDLRHGQRSPAWDLSRDRDMEYYGHFSDPESGEAILFPRDGDVIALEDVVAFSEPVLMTTNLKGYSGKRPLKITFSRLVQENGGTKAILFFSNKLVSRQYSFQGRTGKEYRTYRVSQISAVDIYQFGGALFGYLVKYGEPGTVDGMDFALVLPTRITVEGYLQDSDDAKTSISSNVFIVRQMPPKTP